MVLSEAFEGNPLNRQRNHRNITNKIIEFGLGYFHLRSLSSIQLGDDTITQYALLVEVSSHSGGLRVSR